MKRLALLGAFVAISLVLPSSGASDLPPVDEVLRNLVKRAESERAPESQSSYLCTRQMVTEDMDSAGNIVQRKVKVGQSRSHVGGARDANKWSNKNGFRLDQDLLQRYSFSLERRDVIHGRPALLLHFVPRQPAPPIRQFQDRLLNLARGTVWVDEADYELVRASISLARPVSFGILGAVEAFNFSFQRERAEDGNWLTLWTDTTVKARKFIRPIQTRKRVDWTNFQKLPSEISDESP